jgi:rhodanese-related sulfurtransferase
MSMIEPTPGPMALEITTAEAAALLAAGDGHSLLLDCRTPEEHATARIAGAVLIPMHELAGRIGELEPWRGRTIIVHCHHGVRSLRVAEWLRGRGFEHTASMRGGIDAWSADIDPTVATY